MRVHWLAAGVVAMASTVPASADDDSRPHRPWGKTAILAMSLNDAQACIAQELSKSGTVLALPTDGGSNIDWTMRNMSLAPSGSPFLTFQLRDAAGTITLTGLYRRPMSARFLNGTIEQLGKRCLKIKQIDAAPAADMGKS
jgi:hypothetical protein